MKLILAVSADGFTHRNDADDMRWTGATDKGVFALLTNVGNGIMLAGTTTYNLMSQGGQTYRGRRLSRVSRCAGETLGEWYKIYPDAWLIGGPTTAETALDMDVIDTVYICHNAAILCEGKKFLLQNAIDVKMYLVTTARLSGVHVFVYKLR